MARLVCDYSVETSVAPDRMLAAAADFSERRPDYWPNITRSYYRVYSLVDGVAEIDEGSRPAHHRVRYEWSGDTVRGVTTEATNVVAGSIWQLRARPREGGGSIVDCHIDYTFKGVAGLIVWAVPDRLLHHMLKQWLLQTVDILEKEQQGSAKSPGITNLHKG
jgi:hypothetical protein